MGMQDGPGRVVESTPLVFRSLELSVELSRPVDDRIFPACAEQAGGQSAARDAPFIKRVAARGMARLLMPAT